MSVFVSTYIGVTGTCSTEYRLRGFEDIPRALTIFRPSIEATKCGSTYPPILYNVTFEYPKPNYDVCCNRRSLLILKAFVRTYLYGS